MRQLTSLSKCDWIAEGVLQEQQNGVTVAHCIPPIFPCYAKLFHPIYEDLSVQNRQLTWQEDEQNAQPVEAKTETEQLIQTVLSKSTLVYGGANSESHLTRILWAELARRLEMPFTPTISVASFSRKFLGHSWPRYLIGPEEGNLASYELNALVTVLHRYTTNNRILFHFWFLATRDWKEDLLFEGRVDDVCLFSEEVHRVRHTPTHWFPEDRGWLICTDYDLTFTLIGGPEKLINYLLADEILECVQVQPETRVDWKADLEN